MCAGKYIFALLCIAAGALPAVDYRVTALTPQYILVQADLSKDEEAAFLADSRLAYIDAKTPGWTKQRAYDAIHRQAIEPIRTAFAADFKQMRNGIGYFPVANGRKRYATKDGVAAVNAMSIVYNEFVKLPSPLLPAEKTDLGKAGEFAYDPSVPTPIFKVNQVAYLTGARKYVYVGQWLARGGALPLKAFVGRQFKVCESATGAEVMSGKLTARPLDPKLGIAYFTGEEVLEADISDLGKCGTYYVSVHGLGRSIDFRVSDDALAEAWAHHMQGIFNKRCGIEKESRHTGWPSYACHLDVVRGVNPSEEMQLKTCVTDLDGNGNFADARGNRRFISLQDIVCANYDSCKTHVSMAGGYHDGACFTKSPNQLQIPRALALDYLLRPGNFSDGQLSLPESGNGVPDILDEAWWGVQHLLMSQEEDGGVGTLIVGVGTKNGLEIESPAGDKMRYVIAKPTRNSTLDYAGTAALVARALKKAGDSKRADRLRDSAVKAWNRAMTQAAEDIEFVAPDPVTRRERKHYIFHEPDFYSPKTLFTASLNLAALTGDLHYFDEIVKMSGKLQSQIVAQDARWSRYEFLELAVKDQPLPNELVHIRALWKERRVAEADGILNELDASYPYRTFWYPSTVSFAQNMAWGECHPLRRAEALVAAHAFTGDGKYLDAIALANDFHNGANPSGMCLTSGMGVVYPVRFYDIQSNGDGKREYVGGITPFRWPFDYSNAYFYGVGERNQFLKFWPYWRRNEMMECYAPMSSDYTVWETILPPAAVLGYALDGPRKAPAAVYERKPSDDISKLPGYWAIP